MKKKDVSLLVVIFIAIFTLTLFQNCSKVDVTESSAAALAKTGENVAVATDQQGNEVPVDVAPAEEVIPPAAEPSAPVSDSNPEPQVPVVDQPEMPPVVIGEHNDHEEDDDADHEDPIAEQPAPQPDMDTTVEPDVSPSEDMVAACGLNLKSIHNAVDIAQFKDQDVNMDLIKGKTLIYSSDSSVSLKSLSIDTAVGRTILCGCKVDKLDVKKGRLEVYHSEIKEIGLIKGKLIKDSASILPAGI